MIEFYNSTGGAGWSIDTLPLTSIAEIKAFEAYLLQLGEASELSTFNVSALPTSVQQLYEVVSGLSINCTLQRQLQLVNLLIKYPWNTDGTSLTFSLCYANSSIVRLGMTALTISLQE